MKKIEKVPENISSEYNINEIIDAVNELIDQSPKENIRRYGEFGKFWDSVPFVFRGLPKEQVIDAITFAQYNGWNKRNEKEEPKKEGWPKESDNFFYLTTDGRIYQNDDFFDQIKINCMKSIGNCFRTEKEAEQHKKRLQYLAKNRISRECIDQWVNDENQSA